MKITKVLGDDKFEIRVDPVKKNLPMNFGACHDYVLFNNWTWLFCDDDVSVPSEFGCSNVVKIPVSVQVPIRMMDAF